MSEQRDSNDDGGRSRPPRSGYAWRPEEDPWRDAFGREAEERWRDAFGYREDPRRGGPAWSAQPGGAYDRPSYAGRGPKGYRRSDARVLEDANQALEDDPEIDASEVEVSCRDGEIVLKGSVSDRRTKRLAEACVERVAGVKDVRNELRVGTPGGRGGESAGPSDRAV